MTINRRNNAPDLTGSGRECGRFDVELETAFTGYKCKRIRKSLFRQLPGNRRGFREWNMAPLGECELGLLV